MLKKIKSLYHARQLNQASIVAMQEEVQLYWKLAALYESVAHHKKFPFASLQAMACYRAASALNNSNAQYIVGQRTLNEAKFRNELETSNVFSTESNRFFMQQLYKEAHAFLLAAEQQSHIQAKRLRGLCYINGWGVPIDKEFGFDLVVASIEQENSWDRVQKIFSELGINQSAFFSELFQHRKNK